MTGLAVRTGGRQRAVWALLGVVACLYAGPAPAARAQSGAQELAGEYRVAIPPAEVDRRIERAIDRGVDGLFFAVRGIGASRVRAKSPPIQRVSIEVRKHAIVVTFHNRAGDKRYIAPTDGKAVAARAPDGEAVKLTHRMVQGRLVQTFTSEDGKRVNRSELSADGGRLVLHVAITSPELSAPVRYILPFRRVGGPAALAGS